MSTVVRLPVQHAMDARSRAAVRARLAAVIHHLIDVVDAMDTDPDFEPSLGWSKTMAWGSTDDREEETR